MDADRQLSQQIEGALTREGGVDLSHYDLTVTSDKGHVTLSGSLPNVAAKRRAVYLAAAQSGVLSVIDGLRVEIANPMGDLEIAEHVRKAFMAEKNIEEGQIELETDPEGGVTLRGMVHSLIQRRLCEVLCWWIPGVTRVTNLLLVEPAEEDSDDELKDNLVTILEKDVLVDPKKFRLTVRDGRVTLTGRVDSPLEKDAAEKDCWYTPGVVDVKNELTVG